MAEVVAERLMLMDSRLEDSTDSHQGERAHTRNVNFTIIFEMNWPSSGDRYADDVRVSRIIIH